MSSQHEQLRKEYAELENLNQQLKNCLENIFSPDITTSEGIQNALQQGEELSKILIERIETLKGEIWSIKWKYYDPREMESVVKKEKYRKIENLRGHEGMVLTLQVLPDGRIVSGGGDGTIKIWDGKMV
jgi:WD40 repeat protein